MTPHQILLASLDFQSIQDRRHPLSTPEKRLLNALTEHICNYAVIVDGEDDRLIQQGKDSSYVTDAASEARS